MSDIEFKWYDVDEILPVDTGEYFTLRYGMPYKPEVVNFDNGLYDPEMPDPPHWFDDIGTMNGGGGGVPPWNKLTEEQKYWTMNYGRVTHWFPSPERP